MANADHLKLLRQGINAWNAWRAEEPFIVPDLRWADLTEAKLITANLSNADLGGANLSKATLLGADLRAANLTEANLSGSDLRDAKLRKASVHKTDVTGADLSGSDLTGSDLTEANLSGSDLRWADLTEANLYKADLPGARLCNGAKLIRADLTEANLSGADLREADLRGANLIGTNLSGSDLHSVNLSGANLFNTDLTEANLSGSDLRYASLVETDFAGADLTGCHIYGVSAWNLKLSGKTKQGDLVIEPLGLKFEKTEQGNLVVEEYPKITVSDIEVAQFIYLLLHNEKIRNVIDTITSKVVLILGRFSPERQAVLDALRDELRRRKYLPVVFDFEKPSSQTTDETITLLARMARFVIADLSDAKSILQELRGIVPDLPSVAVQPLILIPQEEPGMFDFFRRYPWVLEPYRYDSQDHLLANLDRSVVVPAEIKALELRGGPG
jgi:uncharacterized protein YjbI with pentapeptide repeats